MTKKRTIKGLITLSEPIYCKKEVLGKEFDAMISGVKAQVFFHRYPMVDESNPDIGISNPLLAPTVGKTWNRGEIKLSWGCPMSHPSGDSCVELISLSFSCEDEDKQCEYLYDGIDRWEQDLLDYLTLETRQNTRRDKNKLIRGCCLELMGPDYIPDNKPVKLYLSFPNKEEYASYEQIEKAIKFANSNTELLFEYQMLLLAYNARRDNNNRAAIVDACSALEVCLIRNLQIQLDKLGYDKDLFLKKKFGSLGDRIKLANNISPAFPKLDYNNAVVKPRNDVVHNRKPFPSDNITYTLIECVENCLDYYNKGCYY